MVTDVLHDVFESQPGLGGGRDDLIGWQDETVATRVSQLEGIGVPLMMLPLARSEKKRRSCGHDCCGKEVLAALLNRLIIRFKNLITIGVY